MDVQAADLNADVGTPATVMDSTTRAQVELTDRRPTSHARSTREMAHAVSEAEM